MKWLTGRFADQSQKGGTGNTQTIGMDPAQFVEEMRRKDERIDQLIAEKDTLKDRVGELERAGLETEIAELRDQKAGLEARLAAPDQAFQEHKERATQIEVLLSDVATQQAIGENRIRSALEGFADLEYAEIDALFEETERQGILMAANSAYGRGLVAEDAIKWHDAYTHYKRAADLSDDLEHIAAYARMTWRLAKGADAVTVQERLVALAEETHGVDSSEYATQLNNLANVVQAQGRYPVAETLFRQALDIDRATVGEEHPDYAIRLNNLAGVVEAQGRSPEAEDLFRQALEIDRATVGEEHPDYAIHLNNLAGVVRAQGRYPEAETLFRQALEIDRATIGEGHPDYATHLNNLAFVVEAQGRYPEAEDLYRQALEIDRATIGEGHPDYAVRLGNLGELLGNSGRVADGRRMLEQALAIFRATLPEDHPYIAETNRRLADLPDTPPGDRAPG